MISSFAGLVSPFSPVLHTAFETAIRHSMLMAYQRSAQQGNLPPQEPDFVAALVLDGSPIIGTHLNAICMAAGGSAKLSGIFCHGKPTVSHSGVGCELGDVLFAHFHTDASGQTSRNALLLQAKMSQKTSARVASSDLHQLKLYTDWPQFSYTNSGRQLNGQQRNVMPKLPHHGAQYLLIDDSPPTAPHSGLLGLPGTFPMGVSPAMRMLDASKSLSFELIDLLAGRSGCNFRDAQHKGNGWSAVVWDLIRYSAVNTFNRIQRSGLRKQPRNVMTYITAGAGFVVSGSRTRTGVMATLFGEDFEKWLDGNDDVRFDMEESEEGDSPSVILLETSIGPQADESR